MFRFWSLNSPAAPERPLPPPARRELPSRWARSLRPGTSEPGGLRTQLFERTRGPGSDLFSVPSVSSEIGTPHFGDDGIFREVMCEGERKESFDPPGMCPNPTLAGRKSSSMSCMSSFFEVTLIFQGSELALHPPTHPSKPCNTQYADHPFFRAERAEPFNGTPSGGSFRAEVWVVRVDEEANRVTVSPTPRRGTLKWSATERHGVPREVLGVSEGSFLQESS